MEALARFQIFMSQGIFVRVIIHRGNFGGCVGWCNQNLITINSKKTKFVVSSNGTENKNGPDVRLKNNGELFGCVSV